MKKLQAFLLVIALTLSCLSAGLVTDAFFCFDNGENPFFYYDECRKALLNGQNRSRPSAMPYSEGEKYIVAFEKSLSLEAVREYIGDSPFELLAFSDERVFALILSESEKSALSEKDGIRYIIPDREERRFADEADAVMPSAEQQSESETVLYPEAVFVGRNDYSYEGDNTVIAVLDSGIERDHPFLSKANIAEGIDIITQTAGVYSDPTGHGTRVAGVIVSSVSGIARNAVILPVRIVSDGEKIKTSDLVMGIYYAADSGADIINMSFGGYDENRAEYDAVEYAFNKGCVIVSSAGNEGRDSEYKNKYAYPASYENVISVASCNNEGKPSVFSQYNDKVDVAAPGENLTLLNSNYNESLTVISNGTSYSAAFVSACCAIALQNSKRSINSAYFEKLLEYSLGVRKDDYVGMGVINVVSVLNNLSKPFVSGISEGKAYFEEVKAFFENASAYLDGEEYLSGDGIFSQGSHALTVTDEFGSITFNFFVDTSKLTYTVKNGEGYIAVYFTKGSAVVDGRPYASGGHITGYGRHTFVLTGPYGNKVSETLFLSDTVPLYSGVENGKTYNNRVKIDIIGNGKAYLNGEEFFDSVFVTESGSYTLLLTDMSGNEKEKASFEVNVHTEHQDELPADCFLADSENGYLLFYNKNESEIRVYRSNNSAELARYIATSGNVLNLYINGGNVIAVAEREILVCSREAMLSAENPVMSRTDYDVSITDSVICNGSVFFITKNGSICSYSNGNTSVITQADTAENDIALSSDGEKVYACSVYDSASVTVIDNGGVSVTILESMPAEPDICVADGIACICGTAFNSDFSQVLFRFADTGKVRYMGDGIIITEQHLYSSENGELLGTYHKKLLAVTDCGQSLCLVYTDRTAETVNKADLFGASAVTPCLTGKELPTKTYEYYLPVFGDSLINDVAYDKNEDRIYVIVYGDNRLYKIDPSDGSLVSSVHLKFVPLSLHSIEKGIAVTFEKSTYVYFAYSDEYISFDARISSVCSYGDRLFAVSGNRVCEYSDGIITYPFDELEADGIECINGRLYIYTVFDLICVDISDFSVLFSDSVTFRGKLLFSDEYIIAGKNIYSAVDYTKLSVMKYEPLALCGDIVITERGLFSISQNKLVLSKELYEYQCVITHPYDTFLFGSDSVTVIRSELPIASAPLIIGVEDGGVYYDRVDITTDSQAVYLDGVHMTDQFSVTSGGEHRITVVMPWDMFYVVDFSLRLTPERIELTNSFVTLNVGQTMRIKAQLYPSGAEGSLVYRAESDNITVGADGTVKAVSQGNGIVSVSVENTDIVAYFNIHVSDNTVISKEPSYIIGRNTNTISGIIQGTDVEEFKNNLDDFDCYYAVYGKDGAEVTSGRMTTGMTVVKFRADTGATDSLLVSVQGDIDGDGYVTVNDCDILYGKLKNNSEMNDIEFVSADVNYNGKLTALDLKIIRSMVESSVTGEKSQEDLYINIPLFVYSGSEFYVTLRDDRLKDTSSVFGNLRFDNTKLSLINVVSFGSEFFYKAEKGLIQYQALGVNDDSKEPRIFRVYFKALSTEGKGSISFENTRIASNGLKYITDRTAEFEIRNDPSSELRIESSNSRLDFKNDVKTYDVIIPKDQEYLMLDFSCPKGCYIYFDNAEVSETAARVLTVIYLTPDGTQEYTFNVTRGCVADGDSSLASLEINGKTVALSEDLFNYSLSLEVKTDIVINAVASSQNAIVQTTQTETENGVALQVICTAEDNTQTVYEIDIVFESSTTVDNSSEPSEEPSNESDYTDLPDESENSDPYSSDNASQHMTDTSGGNGLPIFISVIAVAVAAVLIVTIAIKRKR